MVFSHLVSQEVSRKLKKAVSDFWCKQPCKEQVESVLLVHCSLHYEWVLLGVVKNSVSISRKLYQESWLRLLVQAAVQGAARVSIIGSLLLALWVSLITSGAERNWERHWYETILEDVLRRCTVSPFEPHQFVTVQVLTRSTAYNRNNVAIHLLHFVYKCVTAVTYWSTGDNNCLFQQPTRYFLIASFAYPVAWSDVALSFWCCFDSLILNCIDDDFVLIHSVRIWFWCTLVTRVVSGSNLWTEKFYWLLVVCLTKIWTHNHKLK